MNTTLRSVLALGAALVLTPAVQAAVAVPSAEINGSGDSLAAVRAATAPFHDVEAAIAVGYVPTDDGLKLGGVEWVQADVDQDPTTDTDRPSLLGVPFDGPMPGHGPDQPVHYDLHAWVWQHNPAGMFAPFNPTASC